jgi:hypothetical protein
MTNEKSNDAKTSPEVNSQQGIQAASSEGSERISLVINQDENGNYELIEKPYKGNSKALQFPCGGIKKGQDSFSAAHKALVKGDQFQQLSHLERFMHEDKDGQKEVFIYKGTSTSLPMSQGGQYKTIYMPKDRVLNSSLVTELSKEAFRRYLSHQKKT